jgi:hypothetical protein
MFHDTAKLKANNETQLTGLWTKSCKGFIKIGYIDKDWLWDG